MKPYQSPELHRIAVPVVDLLTDSLSVDNQAGIPDVDYDDFG